jgi:two-component system response regulator FixJ
MPNKPTVFVIDDDEAARGAIESLIESVDLRVKTYGSAKEFLESSNYERPGCLVLDVQMPGMTGLELQQELVERKCEMPIIFVTGHADVPMCIRAFNSGAFGFMEKPVDSQELLEKIHAAIARDQFRRENAAATDDLIADIIRLTPREREMMDLIVSSEPMKEIGKTLRISAPTCSKHRASMLAKMKVANDVQLVRRLFAERSQYRR